VAAILLRTEPAQLLRDAALLRQAVDIGRPVYERHCASCHGAKLQGDAERGVPDIADGYWLYGSDPVDVERTIYYGIRSGHPKSRNLTDMPALVRTGQITPDDDYDVVQYLESIAGQPNDTDAATRGRSIYYSKGNCYDCHANDARGVSDYGTPPLRGPHWLYGGDPSTLYLSVLNGRHGKCPAWVLVLTPVELRAVTVFLLTASRRDPKAS
jgi:cytochrome c oxidase cbb3-type subunit 3